jgi:hypothetical protein
MGFLVVTTFGPTNRYASNFLAAGQAHLPDYSHTAAMVGSAILLVAATAGLTAMAAAWLRGRR